MANSRPAESSTELACTHKHRRAVSGLFPCPATYSCPSGYKHQCGYMLTGEARKCSKCKNYDFHDYHQSCPHGTHPDRPCNESHPEQAVTNTK
ncbi:hypothetical protein PGT21_032777 [Puccinia graminis f. sp. tritici]|uniref:Uncharacterized protein n=1 Tax=Puccinia graminis f. sp. tritici TaxID=56615 RepID=A0A5B0QD37_PUCGR|nr:hypothetical protein PGT21_032777 [Puccinia graminis f. sp. tritici]